MANQNFVTMSQRAAALLYMSKMDIPNSMISASSLTSLRGNNSSLQPWNMLRGFRLNSVVESESFSFFDSAESGHCRKASVAITPNLMDDSKLFQDLKSDGKICNLNSSVTYQDPKNIHSTKRTTDTAALQFSGMVRDNKFYIKSDNSGDWFSASINQHPSGSFTKINVSKLSNDKNDSKLNSYVLYTRQKEYGKLQSEIENANPSSFAYNNSINKSNINAKHCIPSFISPGKVILGYVYRTDPECKDQISQSLHNVNASMNGRILKKYVSVGEEVQKGSPLVVLEAMKMETIIRSPIDGKVNSINVSVGSTVTCGDPLVYITPAVKEEVTK